MALALVVVAVAASTTDAAARRRNQKFWKMNRQNRDRNGDDFFRSSDGDLVYVGKGAAGKGQQVNMGFKFPTRPTTVSKRTKLTIFYTMHHLSTSHKPIVDAIYYGSWFVIKFG